jgi:hypothetical protein
MSDLIKYTKEDFLTKFEPMRMSKEIRTVKNVSDAIKADSNGLSFYRKQIGEDTVLAVIELHLLSLGQSINVHEKLSKFQIQEIAGEIITLYYYMNMTEITYVLRKAKRGEYGKIDYALNMPAVMQWFATYADERMTYSMQNADSIASAHIQNAIDSKDLNIKVIETLGKIKDEIPEGFNREQFNEWKKENDL